MRQGREAPDRGELRAALLKVHTFNLPLTDAVTIRDNHTVNKPVYLIGVKDEKFVEIGRFE